MTTHHHIMQEAHDREKKSIQANYIWRIRENRRVSIRRNPLFKIGLGCSGLISLLAALFSIFIALTFTNITKDLPSIENLPSFLEPTKGQLLGPTTVYDRSGEHVLVILRNPMSSDRQYLYFEDEAFSNGSDTASLSTPPGALPKNLVLATLAVSDPHFWTHPGFSLLGKNLKEQPTLAQRLAFDFLLYDEAPSWHREIRERLLAAQMTIRFGRKKILEWYLNSANYGRFAFGADAATLLYFSKTASDLSLGEAALIAGVSESPDLNPLDAPQIALERQKHVIQELLRYRMITPQEGIQAVQEDLSIEGFQNTQDIEVERSTGIQGQVFTIEDLEPKIAPAYSKWVLSQLENVIPLRRLERGGFRIITTLDIDLQRQTSCAIEAQQIHLQSDPSSYPTSEDYDCQAARLLPTLLPQVWQIPLSSNDLKAEAVILDPITGQILALVGDPPVTIEKIPLRPHPAGSLISPFIYLTAYSRGYSPASLVWDIPSESQDLEIRNIDGEFHGPVRMRIALANDFLLPAEETLNQIGAEHVLRIAQQLSISHPKNIYNADVRTKDFINPESINTSNRNDSNLYNLSGGSDTGSTSSVLSLFRPLNLVEICQAFGVLDNHGVLVGSTISTSNQQYSPGLEPIYPVTVLRIEDASGQILHDVNSSQSRPIITPQLAYLMTHTLSDEAARWISMGHPNALEIGRPVAVKIGRTPLGNSNWTIGYTPQRVAGVWIGSESQKSPSEEEFNQLVQDATFGLWHAIIQYAIRDQPYLTWTTPPGLSTIQVCDPSGLLPTKDCPNVIDEIFLAGSEPIQTDALYKTIQVNYETGNLSTIFTPPDLVENRTFLMFPLEASKWAKQAGIDTPPEVFDLIPASVSGQPGAQITSPTMFDLVNGKVTLYGEASGDDFAFYRIQVGKSLFPKSWFQIGEDVTNPVSEGKLATWDTTGLSGLYAIQLLVVNKDQSVKRITTMVTVDNTPPEVKILYPNDEEELQITLEPNIVFQTWVNDDLGIENVTIYLDGQLYSTLIQAPYSISWASEPGKHTLRVLATDIAGNSSVAQINFVVQD